MSRTLTEYCRSRGLPVISLCAGDAGRLPVAYADMHVGLTEDVIVFGKSYFSSILDGEAVYLRQSHRDNKPEDFAHYHAREIAHRKWDGKHIDEECLFLGGLSGEDRYFGHFIFEFLYRIHAFAIAGLLHLPVVVQEEVPETWLSFLRLYGITRFIKIPQNPATHFRRVWMSTAPCHLMASGQKYAFWDEGIKAVTRGLRGRCNPGPGPRRVFIGRKDAAHRRLVNEAEVWAYLKTQGFTYADVQGQPAVDQVKTVRDAEIVVVVGGSGGVLTHFAPSTCRVIELLAPHLNGTLGSLGVAAVLGQPFTRIPTPVVVEGLHADTRVGLDHLKMVVEGVTS